MTKKRLNNKEITKKAPSESRVASNGRVLQAKHRELAACTPEGERAIKEILLFQNKRTVSCFAGSSTRLRGSPLSEGAKGEIALKNGTPRTSSPTINKDDTR